ncbi:1-deoxy-D-xylulose-5-phosphate reductoisomerase [Candidatus Schneideria nysicola]|uniref:1-deoxy-D-xylulose-5-phosphate reductoisomerase n=1 Tax=Candidatus Schneideria nysicola TaxID=1081631 RepID=UPI001CAA5CAE|nr:1-deoxy-D-xylulose-5-phosphate reductoisomerase [Candidatus Schneideria nysicola]UAJ66043.1 1-deoxy-D-xylulose-5-phosphate reductoisomerase [Candidatus Schneideria nysicola]
MKKKLTILGSTGSIGIHTLTVIQQNSEKFAVHALVAGYNTELMTKQCWEFKPKWASMASRRAAQHLKFNLNQMGLAINVLFGIESACKLASLEEIDIVMSAIAGTVGLAPTLSAIKAGKRVLLANKESIVICGRLLMDAVRMHNAHLLPVDSEHNAIFQCLPKPVQENLGYASLKDHGISKIILTGSGGPFRFVPLSKLESMTPEQACSHPNWIMGKKISVDSASMMNKGLEYIEAKHLFNASSKQIKVVLHPQSIIHSMIHYIDGSIMAQMGLPDMRTHIAHVMAYPDRISINIPQLNFYSLDTLSFGKPDKKRYPCLYLAIEASLHQATTIILNAVNEIAVSAFLSQKIRFTDIAVIIQEVLDNLYYKEPKNIEEVMFIDNQARKKAFLCIKKFMYER